MLVFFVYVKGGQPFFFVVNNLIRILARLLWSVVYVTSACPVHIVPTHDASVDAYHHTTHPLSLSLVCGVLSYVLLNASYVDVAAEKI